MQLSDGYIANQICFWETAKLKQLYSDAKQPKPYYCRNFQLYSSRLTQPASIAQCTSYQNKIQNWKWLNKNVFKKINIQIDDEVINSLAKVDKVLLAKFYTLLIQKIDTYKQNQNKEELETLAKKQMQNSIRMSQISSGYYQSNIKPTENEQCPLCKLYKQEIELLNQRVRLLQEQLKQYQ